MWRPLSKDPMRALPQSVPLPLQQATTDTHLHWILLDTHRQVWVSLLWAHCSFLLGPGVHNVLSVPFKSLFPQSCVSSVIKSHWPPKSNSLGVFSPGWEICCGAWNFLDSARIALVCPVVREEAMAPHSSTLAWKIPWTEESGRLQSMGSLRIGHD